MRVLILLLALSGAARAQWTPEFSHQEAKVRAALDAGDRAAAAAALAGLRVSGDGSPSARADMLRRRAEFKSELHDLPGTEADLRAALAAQPRDFETLCTLTQFLRERGRLTESLAVAQTLTSVTEGVTPGNRAEKWLQRAETLMRLGRYDESEADVVRALRDKPEDVPSLWLMAQVLLHAGRARDALPFADRMIAAASTPAEKGAAFSQRAQVRETLGDRKGSEDDVAAGLAANPSDHLALEARVQRLREDGRYPEALALSDKMVEAGRSAKPTRRALLFQQRAQVKLLLGDAAGAEADLRAALAQEPDSLPSLRTLAQMLLDQGRPAEAAETATRLLAAAAEASPNVRAEAFLLRARAWVAAGLSGAAEDRAEARRLAPDSAVALRESSQAALAAGDVPRALDEAERLVAVVARASGIERAEARLCRGAALLAAGRRADAEKDFLEAARLEPGSIFARERLVTIALEDARYDEAEARAEDLFKVTGSTASKSRASALVLRARVRSGRGDRKAAVEDLSAALDSDPSSHDALVAMVDALQGQGDPAALRLYTERLVASSERLFAAASAAPPGDPAALQTMTTVVTELTRLGRGDLSLPHAQVLVARSSSAGPARRAESLCARAAAYDAVERSGDALADLRAAVAAAPSEREPRIQLFRMLARLGRSKEAMEAADAVVALSSGTPASSADALLWRAARRADGGDWSGAEADHAAAESVLPGIHARDAESGARWAAVAAARGGPKAAWSLLAKLRAAPAASAVGRAALASAEAESRWSSGDAAGAEAAMAAALSADPAAACAAPLLDDRSKAAAAWFDACVARRPRDPVLLNDRGVARWTSGRRPEALADFRSALAAKPGFLPAAMSLASALETDGGAAAGAKVLETALASPGGDPALRSDARAQLERLKKK